MMALAAVSLVAYSAAVSSVPLETWRQLPSPPALHDVTVAVGITALVLTPTSAFLDAVVTSVGHTPTDEPHAGILTYIDGLRTTLLTIVTLIIVDTAAVVDTNPMSIRTNAAAIILIGGSAAATAACQVPDTTRPRSLTGALRRLVGWCGVVAWPAYHVATQRLPSATSSVLYLAVLTAWSISAHRRRDGRP